MYQVTPSSTQHGLNTPHGSNTPHRLPSIDTTTPVDFFKMVELLYPTGTSWNLPENSQFKKLHDGINLSLVETAVDANGLLDASFPDNNNFDANDASLWEYRYGIEYNAALTLAQRRQNIYAAMAFPQNVLGRQSPSYIEASLREAGFDVHIYENIFFSGSTLYQKTPQQVLGTVTTITQFGGGTQFGGQTQFGGGNFSVIANNETAESYNPGGILWPTFFISGATISTPADVSKFREREFRRLVLKLKPAHTVAFLIVNFI
jgi:uncharacterized protein YmfQ (DUF2313 family)